MTQFRRRSNEFCSVCCVWVLSKMLIFFLCKTVLVLNFCVNFSPASTSTTNIGGHENATNILIRLPQGLLKGNSMVSRDGRIFYSFKSIPYAQRPKRFEPPQPPLSWPGIRDGTIPSPICAQLHPFSSDPGAVIGFEDCLYLTVSVPEHIFNRGWTRWPNTPILFSIHGGGFSFGYGEENGPRYFMDEDIILVTLNYRLNALGFLSTGDGTVPGNMGLKDIVMGLKWVRENIQFFGGQPDLVTVQGQSAGGSVVTLLMLSPMTRGLFSRAIVQSCSLFSPFAWSQNPGGKARQLGHTLGCPSRNSIELRECLKMKDYRQIILAKLGMMQWESDPMTLFGATVEIPSNRPQQMDEPFLSVHPLQLLRQGQFHRVPILMGYNQNEGLLPHTGPILTNDKLTQDLNTNWSKIAPITLSYIDLNLSGEENEVISGKIKNFYFGQNVDKISPKNLQNLENLYTDRYYLHGVHMMMVHFAKLMPVFPYHFSYKGNFSMLKNFGIQTLEGVTHMDELQYLFDVPYLGKFEEDGEDKKFSQKFIKIWTSFMNTGAPLPIAPLDDPWPPISLEDTVDGFVDRWYDINVAGRSIVAPFSRGRIFFWNFLLANQLKAENIFVPNRN